VDDIATAGGISRATLYQYFASKDEIFSELLAECGGALMRVVRRLGPLGPTAQGFDNLHWWLGEWAWVYDRYATMFAQWNQLDTPASDYRPTVSGFVDAYTARIASRLESSGYTAPPEVDLAAAVMLVVHRMNAFRSTRGTTASAVPDEVLLDGLAVTVQLVLFPDTPDAVLASLGAVTAGAEVAPAPALPVPSNRFAGRSARVRRTVRDVLDAAARVFAERGYQAVSMDEIATAAGVARGTVYKYFSDKSDLLSVLAEEAHTELAELLARLPGPVAGHPLAVWLHAYLPAYRRHAGVVAVWSDRQVTTPVVLEHADGMSAALRANLARALGHVDRSYPFDLRVATLVASAALERLPLGLTVRGRDVADDEVVETMAAFLERGLLNPGNPPD
ncbi:TetR/AcrR family transcriptional regulator, partial [Pseudonocardia sp. KRD291]|uniref:TetR/AcrR family transcriptional regulator n=1 Tax=Pseudonocardia sp. KRD291 TaxID=2792007 RepID=UPI001C4A1385